MEPEKCAYRPSSVFEMDADSVEFVTEIGVLAFHRILRSAIEQYVAEVVMARPENRLTVDQARFAVTGTMLDAAIDVAIAITGEDEVKGTLWEIAEGLEAAAKRKAARTAAP